MQPNYIFRAVCEIFAHYKINLVFGYDYTTEAVEARCVLRCLELGSLESGDCDRMQRIIDCNHHHQCNVTALD